MVDFLFKILCPICRPNNEKVKFQRHLKDNSNLELPSKQKGLKTVVRRTFCAAQKFNK